jgi:hypothetical protein
LRWIKLVIEKKKAKLWTRLTIDKKKYPFIKIDWDNMFDEKFHDVKIKEEKKVPLERKFNLPINPLLFSFTFIFISIFLFSNIFYFLNYFE